MKNKKYTAIACIVLVFIAFVGIFLIRYENETVFLELEADIETIDALNAIDLSRGQPQFYPVRVINIDNEEYIVNLMDGKIYTISGELLEINLYEKLETKNSQIFDITVIDNDIYATIIHKDMFPSETTLVVFDPKDDFSVKSQTIFPVIDGDGYSLLGVNNISNQIKEDVNDQILNVSTFLDDKPIEVDYGEEYILLDSLAAPLEGLDSLVRLFSVQSEEELIEEDFLYYDKLFGFGGRESLKYFYQYDSDIGLTVYDREMRFDYTNIPEKIDYEGLTYYFNDVELVRSDGELFLQYFWADNHFENMKFLLARATENGEAEIIQSIESDFLGLFEINGKLYELVIDVDEADSDAILREFR